MAPPAITPVPSEAGLRITLALPKVPITSWLIVRASFRSNLKEFFFAERVAFKIY
jgi:hypothetical protein